MHRLAAIGMATTVTALSLAAAPQSYAAPVSSGSGITVIDQGGDENGGWVAYASTHGGARNDAAQQTETARPDAIITTSAGGGTWVYGSTVNAVGQKVCISQYNHPTVSHSSSVSMNGWFNRGSAGPGQTSYARVAGYTTATCYAYWSK